MEEIVTEFESILVYKLRLIKGDASSGPFSPRTHAAVLYSDLLLTLISHVDRGSDPPQVWEFHILSWSHPCCMYSRSGYGHI